MLAKAGLGLRFNEHIEGDGPTVFAHACKIAFVAQDAYYTKAMMGEMNGNCSNIQVLLNKYSDFCQQLSRDADPRLKAWIACLRAGQQTCGGPGLP